MNSCLLFRNFEEVLDLKMQLEQLYDANNRRFVFEISNKKQVDLIDGFINKYSLQVEFITKDLYLYDYLSCRYRYEVYLKYLDVDDTVFNLHNVFIDKDASVEVYDFIIKNRDKIGKLMIDNLDYLQLLMYHECDFELYYDYYPRNMMLNYLSDIQQLNTVYNYCEIDGAKLFLFGRDEFIYDSNKLVDTLKVFENDLINFSDKVALQWDLCDSEICCLRNNQIL